MLTSSPCGFSLIFQSIKIRNFEMTRRWAIFILFIGHQMDLSEKSIEMHLSKKCFDEFELLAIALTSFIQVSYNFSRHFILCGQIEGILWSFSLLMIAYDYNDIYRNKKTFISNKKLTFHVRTLRQCLFGNMRTDWNLVELFHVHW